MDLSALGLDEEVKAFLKGQTEFTIDRVSQEGGNCDIFFGDHNIFGRRIALKIYYGTNEKTSHYEPRILSKLDHPNILRVRDAKRIGRSYSYFMTDEICGGDLEKCLIAGQLDLKDKLNIIHGVLNGLTELHRDDICILHRDLKPKNILIYSDTKAPLISDFGSIKQFDQALGYVTGSTTTPVYKPKEVFDGNKYSKQSDIYQIGVTMFQILGGYFPGTYIEWLSEKEKDKWNAVIGDYEKSVFVDKVLQRLVTQNKLLKIESLPEFIDEKTIKVIQRATHPQLHLRYANTAAFMSDLFKVQKRLTNWCEVDGILCATKPKGEQFRIVPKKNGYLIEKLGNAGWRKNGDSCENRRDLCQQVNGR